MHDHIEHLEDLLLTGELKKLTEILQDIILNRVQYSIKYDGSPALVFGKDPNTQKIFVGTKSAFNKKKKIRCTTPNEIDEHYHNKPFCGALQCLLEHLKPFSLNEIIQSDMLWFKGLINEYEFTKNFLHSKPNTIEYILPKPAEQISLIIVPHSQTNHFLIDNNYFQPINQITLNELLMCGIGIIDPRIFSFSLKNIKNITEIIIDIKDDVSFTYDPDDKKLVNDLLRNDEYYNFPVSMKWKYYQDLINIKESLYDQLNRFVLSRNIISLPYLNNFGYYHEGFVVSNKDIIVKIVDRTLFSKQNFLEKDAIYRKKSKPISQGS